MTDYRKAYGLPKRYFLSLGRMVEKKNLSTLVEAYARYVKSAVERDAGRARPPDAPGTCVMESNTAGPAEALRDGPQAKAQPYPGETGHSSHVTRHSPISLVFVGSGELEEALESQARALGLRVVDRRGISWQSSVGSRPALDGGQEAGQAASRQLTTDDSVEQHGTVLFYGFRQLEENPVFYALAEAFILPSLYEEWGLVVNEAMACSLPVIVSRTAGCAEDLLPGSESWQCCLRAVSPSLGSVDSVQSGEDAEDLVPEAPAGGSPPAECLKRRSETAATNSLNPQPSTINSLEERPNGFVFDPTSVEALAEAMRRIAQMGDGRLKMGRRSRDIVERFSCDNFARQALQAAQAASVWTAR
jgi:glycosyltransferase involved in cell wall biosynthesis